MCLCTFIGGLGGGGGDVGGFINRAVAVIELFFLSINLKLLKQNKYSWATTVSYVFHISVMPPLTHQHVQTKKITPFIGSYKYMNFELMLLEATGL